MKLALIIDDYLPHSTRVGAKMFHELGLELLSRGHDVTVITPDISLQAIYSISMIDGIKVWRFKSGPLKDVGKAKRAINETLLSFRAWRCLSTSFNMIHLMVSFIIPPLFFGATWLKK